MEAEVKDVVPEEEVSDSSSEEAVCEVEEVGISEPVLIEEEEFESIWLTNKCLQNQLKVIWRKKD